jgi:DNA-binding IclR family transcriptional regulator
MAFDGAPGRVYDKIRRTGIVVLSSDREPGLTGISTPVWNAAGVLVGALTLTMPEQRMKPVFTDAVLDAAKQLLWRFGGAPPS